MASLERQQLEREQRQQQQQDRPKFDNFQDIKASLLQDIQNKLKESSQLQKDSFYDVVMGFLHAINWREPFILGLLGAHLLLFLLVVALRHNTTALGVIFFGAVGVIFFAQQLNALGAAHWETFASQPYFDERGAFFTALVSGPLLLLLFVILVLYLLQVANMMVVVKRKQLVLAARARQQEGQQPGSGQAGGAAAAAGSKKDR